MYVYVLKFQKKKKYKYLPVAFCRCLLQGIDFVGMTPGQTYENRLDTPNIRVYCIIIIVFVSAGFFFNTCDTTRISNAGKNRKGSGQKTLFE